MGDGKDCESSGSALEVKAPQAQSLITVSQRGSQEPTFPELKNVPNHTPEEEEDVTSRDDDNELVLVETQMVDDAAEFAAISQAIHPKRSYGKGNSSKGSQPLIFDDREMIDVPEGEDTEQEYFRHSAKLDRLSLASYDVPIGPFETEKYEQHFGMERNASLLYKIPGVRTACQALSASTRIARRGIGDVNGSVIHTARRTCQAAVVTRQVGQHFVDGALIAGQDAMIQVQESWSTWPRGFNVGILAFSELLMEGFQSLPPSDTVIRPQGRRMNG